MGIQNSFSEPQNLLAVDNGKIELTIELDKFEYSPDEPISIKIHLENIGPDPFTYIPGYGCGSGLSYSVNGLELEIPSSDLLGEETILVSEDDPMLEKIHPVLYGKIKQAELLNTNPILQIRIQTPDYNKLKKILKEDLGIEDFILIPAQEILKIANYDLVTKMDERGGYCAAVLSERTIEPNEKFSIGSPWGQWYALTQDNFIKISPGHYFINAKLDILNSETGKIFSPINGTTSILIGSDDLILPPLKQKSQGVLPNSVVCSSNLQLVLKSTDNSPACVKPSTALKILERGWTEIGDAKTPGSKEQSPKSDLTVRTWTSGFWVKSQNIFTITPEKIIISKRNTNLDEPPIEIPITKQEWQELEKLINFPNFLLLPDSVGDCPGCTDNEVHWIEISNSTVTKLF